MSIHPPAIMALRLASEALVDVWSPVPVMFHVPALSSAAVGRLSHIASIAVGDRVLLMPLKLYSAAKPLKSSVIRLLSLQSRVVWTANPANRRTQQSEVVGKNSLNERSEIRLKPYFS